MNKYINYDLYHYFNYLKDPFASYMDIDLGSPKEYANMAKRIGRLRGYDITYFSKRLEREKFCKQFLENKNGKVDRKCPVYSTLGREDHLCFDIRLQPYSLPISLNMLDTRQLLFIIGDSIGTDYDLLGNRVFTYDDFYALSDEDIIKMLPDDPVDRYIEVQIWENNYISKYKRLIEKNLFAYTECLTEEIIKDRFPTVFENKNGSLKDWLCHMDEIDWFYPFRRLLKNGNREHIPRGNMHGIPHSVRCAWLTLCLANLRGLNADEAVFAARCAAYHDCGRSLGENQQSHAGSAPTDKLFPPNEARRADFIISCHNLSSEQIKELAKLHKKHIKEVDISIAEIIHDADSLDYLRLTVERGIRHYEPSCLILSESIGLIPMAFELFVFSFIDPLWISRIFKI